MKYAASFGAALALCAVAPANAQQVRTFVSTVGDDLAAAAGRHPARPLQGLYPRPASAERSPASTPEVTAP